jgi:hypothetical protein
MRPGQLLERLAEQSASYIAFLASFAMPVLFGSIIVRCSQGCATATAACTWPTFPSDVGADPLSDGDPVVSDPNL